MRLIDRLPLLFDYSTQVAAGARFLDDREPGWSRLINPDTLRMELSDSCILAQIGVQRYGMPEFYSLAPYLSLMTPYARMCAKHALTRQRTTAFGFNMTFTTQEKLVIRLRWRALNAAWRYEILLRSMEYKYSDAAQRDFALAL